MAFSMSTGLHSLTWFALGVLIFLAVYTWRMVVTDAKRKVNNIPKVPMSMCNIHGLYPTSAAIDVTAVAEGRNDLPVHICPFCIHDRFKASQKKLETE